MQTYKVIWPVFYWFIFSVVCRGNAGRVVEWKGFLPQLSQKYSAYFSHISSPLKGWWVLVGCVRYLGAGLGWLWAPDVPRSFYLGKTKQLFNVLSSSKEVLAIGELKAHYRLFPLPFRELSIFWFATLLFKKHFLSNVCFWAVMCNSEFSFGVVDFSSLDKARLK